MDRVFLDANVLFSAAYSKESGLARLWRVREATLVTSSHAIEEARRNLEDDAQKSRLEQLLETVEIISTWPAGELPDGVKLPDKDAPILLAAVAARATHLLTGDRRDFGPLLGKSVAGISVQLPAAYLTRKAAA